MQQRGERSGRGRPAGKKVVKDVDREWRKNGRGEGGRVGALERRKRERKERAGKRRRAGKKRGDGKRASRVRT